MNYSGVHMCQPPLEIDDSMFQLFLPQELQARAGAAA